MINDTKVTYSGLISHSRCGMGVFGGVVTVSLMSIWHLWHAYMRVVSTE